MPQGVKIPKEQIKAMKIMRANGSSYEEIADVTGLALSTVAKYCKDIRVLPPSHQRNPFEPIAQDKVERLFEKSEPTAKNIIEAHEIEDIQWYIDKHKSGTRFKGPLDKISLEQLHGLMEEPTDYHSPLSIREWVKYYLGGDCGGSPFLKFSPHTWTEKQLDLLEIIFINERIMVETHRDFGKTMIAESVLTYWTCENREGNYAIISDTKSKALDRVKHIGDTLIKNKRIIADYGFLPHMKRYKGITQPWTKERITVKRRTLQTDPTLTCFSTETSEATGPHFDLVLYDDIWNRKFHRNLSVNKKKWFDWYEGEMEGSLEKGSREIFLLTRKGVNDIYRDLEDKQFYVVYKRPAVLKFPSKYEYVYTEIEGRMVITDVDVQSDDWEIQDPERFDIEFFLMKRKKQGEEKFRAEYQLDPISASGEFFKWKDLRFINGYDGFFKLLEEKKWGKYFRVLAFMDLAFGKSMRADYTAIVVIGYYQRNFYFLEALIKRGASENDMVDMIREVHSLFPKTLRIIYIEDDLQQIATVERLKKKCAFMSIQGFSSRQEMTNIKKVYSDRIDAAELSGKQLRILSQLEGIVEDNKLFVNKNMRNFDEFKDEFISFPDSRHFDIIDALGNGISKIDEKGALIRIIGLGPKRPW